MTVREAFSFFRGQAKVQEKLRRLIDVGLDYLSLDRPSSSLSGGESQRIALAAGESRQVSFTLHTDDLAFHNRKMELVT